MKHQTPTTPLKTFLASCLMVALLLPGHLLGGEHHEHPPAADEHPEHGSAVASSHEHGESAAGHSHEMASRHGGQVVMTADGTHVEFVFRPQRVQLFLYDGKQQPSSFQGASGHAVVAMRGGGRHEAQLRYHPAKEGGMDFLAGRFDFAKVAPGEARIEVSIEGVQGREEPLEATAKFKGLAGGHHGEAEEHEEHGHGSHGHGAAKPSHDALYVCPMCAGVQSDRAGTCPKCGMPLEKARSRKGASPAATGDANAGRDPSAHDHSSHSH